MTNRNRLFLEEKKLTRLRKMLALALTPTVQQNLPWLFPSWSSGPSNPIFPWSDHGAKTTFCSFPLCLNDKMVFGLSESRACWFHCFSIHTVYGASEQEVLNRLNVGQRSKQGWMISQASWERKNMNLLSGPCNPILRSHWGKFGAAERTWKNKMMGKEVTGRKKKYSSYPVESGQAFVTVASSSLNQKK